MKKTRFAVYGTLKKGFHNHYLLDKANFLGSTKTSDKYTMHSLGGFPAVTTEGHTSIEVEVYETDDEQTINSINTLEGFTGIKGHAHNWYDTETIETEFGDAEMFVFRKSCAYPIIESGIWQNQNSY